MARISAIHAEFNVLNPTKQSEEFYQTNEQRFREQLLAKIPSYVKVNTVDGSRLLIMINVDNTDGKLNIDTNEHYHMEAYENTGVVIVKIKAETMFGARHAIETLAQLIVFDDIREQLQIVCDFEIDDKPQFPHRGFLLDTSRNYFTVESIKRIIGKKSGIILLIPLNHIIDSKNNFCSSFLT